MHEEIDGHGKKQVGDRREQLGNMHHLYPEDGQHIVQEQACKRIGNITLEQSLLPGDLLPVRSENILPVPVERPQDREQKSDHLGDQIVRVREHTRTLEQQQADHIDHIVDDRIAHAHHTELDELENASHFPASIFK